MFIEHFRNRLDAGELLANRLAAYAGRPDVIVLALPRGGVPVGYAVAKAMRAPLDVMVVRKLGVPGHAEFAMGAIASGGEYVLNRELVQSLGVPGQLVEATARQELAELERREQLYRAGRPPLQLRGCTVILVDDGLATGASMRVAVKAVRKTQPARVIVAVPVGSPDTCSEMGKEADEVICDFTPEPFNAVGLWYEDFSQTSDEEVQRLLEEARHWQAGRTSCSPEAAAGSNERTQQEPAGN
jgi:predicted phosphoribosyltransferase